MEHDVFVSYSRKDTKIVNLFVSRLREAGYNVWIDKEGIYSGVQFRAKIVQAINQSSLVLFFSSANSNASEWTFREIIYSSSIHKTIIIVRLDNTRYNPRIALDLVESSYTEYNPEFPDWAISELIASIAALLKECETTADFIDFETDTDDQTDTTPQEPAAPCGAHFGKKDNVQSIEHNEVAAEHGHTESQFKMGTSYFFGRGVKQDYREAARWYRQAAERGHKIAQSNLGACYEKGQGVQQDYKEAVKWYQKAAEQGYAIAQYNLGICFMNGRGIEQDFEKAVRWFRDAALQSHAPAQCYLGVCYYHGKGVERNRKEALKWFRKAGSQGNAYAQYYLGVCYENGHEVEQNYNEALKWYRRAAKKGELNAIEAIERLSMR